MNTVLILCALTFSSGSDFDIAVAAYSYRNFTFLETVDEIQKLDVKLVEGFNFQKIGGDIPGNLDPASMSDEAILAVRKKLDGAGLTLIALYYGGFPNDEAACRRIFERSKTLGVRYFVSEPSPDVLPLLNRLAVEYGMVVGLHGHDKKSSPNTWHPSMVHDLCATHAPGVRAFSDTGHWIRSQLDPPAGAEVLGECLVGVEIHDTDANGVDVPLGTGVGHMREFVRTLQKSHKGENSVILSIEYVSHPENPTPDIQACLRFLKEFRTR